MLDWTVIGVDRNTGEERVLAVNALTEDEARAEASAKGIIVESVRIKTSPEPGERAPKAIPVGNPAVRIRKKRDPLSIPRLVMLLIAAAYSLGVGFAGFDRIYAYMLWGCWLALGVAGIILRAARS